MSFPMPHRVTVQRETETSDSAGGTTTAWVVRFWNVACFIQPISAAKQAEYRAANFRVTHNCYTDKAGINKDDRLLFADNGVSRELGVVGVRRMCEREGFYHASLLETQHG